MTKHTAALLLAIGCLMPLPSVAQPAASPDNQIRTRINGIYARYRGAMQNGGPADDMALYTRRTRDLIARWHASRPKDEVTPLGDFDWFCQCQDFDDKTFGVKAVTVRKARTGAYEANVAYNVGWEVDRRLRLVMMFEDGGWKVDDILFARDTGIASLRVGLAAEIRDAAKH